MKGAKHSVFSLSICCGAHVYELVRKFVGCHSFFEQLNTFKFEENAVQLPRRDVPYFLFEILSGFSPSNDVDVGTFPISESSKVLAVRISF